jgi:hypothetical protein
MRAGPPPCLPSTFYTERVQRRPRLSWIRRIVGIVVAAMVLQLVAHSAVFAAVTLPAGHVGCGEMHHAPPHPDGDSSTHHACCVGCAAALPFLTDSTPDSPQVPRCTAGPAPAPAAIGFFEPARWTPSSPRAPPATRL